MLRWWSARYANVTEDNQGCSSMPEGLPGLLSKKGTLPFFASSKWPCGPVEHVALRAGRREKHEQRGCLPADQGHHRREIRLSTFIRPHPTRCAIRGCRLCAKGRTAGVCGSDDDDADNMVVVVNAGTVDPDGEAIASRIAVGVGDLDSEVELLVGRWLRLSQAEAADIEGVVVVAGNAIGVADVFDQDAVVGSARRPLHLVAGGQAGDRQGAVGVDRGDRSDCFAA